MSKQEYDLIEIQKLWPEYVKKKEEVVQDYLDGGWGEELKKAPMVLRLAYKLSFCNICQEITDGKYKQCFDFEHDVLAHVENFSDKKYFLYNMNCITVQCELSKALHRLYPEEYPQGYRQSKEEQKAFCRRYEMKVDKDEELFCENESEELEVNMEDNVIEMKDKDELLQEAKAMLLDPVTAEEGFRRLKVLADSGFDRAACMFPFAVAKGLGVEKDEKKAFEMVSELCEAHLPEAYYLRGIFYEDGTGVEQDYQKAYFSYRLAANWDFPPAYNNMARLHHLGLGTGQSDKLASSMNMMAANLGYKHAMYHLAHEYFDGLGVEQNNETGFAWLRKAADGGCVRAIVELADLHLDIEDYVTAFKFYSLAAKKNHPRATYVLHQFYREGLGVEKDIEKAFGLCQKALDLGDKDAITDMGCWYEFGWGGEKNYEKALEWYLKAGEAGQAHGWQNAGYAYANGRGCEQDDDKALECFKKSADLGYECGMTSIGYYYRDVEEHQDADKAFKYLCIGAAFGDAEAMNDIGYALENGIGIEKNDKWSFKFYKKSAETGDAVGMSNVAQCYAEGRGIERNTQLALKWYEDAKANNCAENAITETARVLREQGILVNDNVEE